VYRFEGQPWLCFHLSGKLLLQFVPAEPSLLPRYQARSRVRALCVQSAMHEVFEEDDMRQLFRWLTKFLNNPYSEDDQLVPAGVHA